MPVYIYCQCIFSATGKSAVCGLYGSTLFLILTLFQGVVLKVEIAGKDFENAV